MSTYEIYKGLHAAVLNAVAASGHPDIARFRAGFARGEQGWLDPGTRTLPAADFLDSMEARGESVYKPVLDAFTACRYVLFWSVSEASALQTVDFFARRADFSH